MITKETKAVGRIKNQTIVEMENLIWNFISQQYKHWEIQKKGYQECTR